MITGLGKESAPCPQVEMSTQTLRVCRVILLAAENGCQGRQVTDSSETRTHAVVSYDKPPYLPRNLSAIVN